MEKLDLQQMSEVTGGKGETGKREKYVSSFFCEACGATIRLNGVYTLERARKEHYAKFHPGMRQPTTQKV